MKKLIIFLAIIASIFAYNIGIQDLQQQDNDINIDSDIMSRVYEEKIIELLNRTMENLRNNGIPSAGIKSLDPLTGNFDLSSISIPSVQIGTLAFSNVNVTGLTFFDTTFSLSLAGLKFKYKLAWPRITAKTRYDFNISISKALFLFGHGDIDFYTDDFYIEGSGKIGTDVNKFIFLQNFDIAFGIDPAKSQFNITGFMNDKEFSRILTEKLIPFIAQATSEFKDVINMIVSPQVIKLFNNNVKNKTISDIINGNFPYKY